MARRVKVPIPGSAGKFAMIDMDATSGAELGVNLTYQGRVLQPSEILNSAVQPGDVIFQGGFDGGGPGGDLTTDAVIEGSNLYFTAERAQDAAGAVLDGSGDVPLTYTTGPRKISAALSATSVTAGTYGDATHVATFTVDAKGRLTAAGSVAITASGNVATDAIWDAKGDLAAGTGANTAARLPVGANLSVLLADSTQTTGLRWSAHARLDDSGLTADRNFLLPDYAGTVAVLDVNSAIHSDVFSRHGKIGATPSTGATWAGFDAIPGVGHLILFDGSAEQVPMTWTDKAVTMARQFALLGTAAATLSASQNDYAPLGLDTANRLELIASGADRTVTGLDHTLMASGGLLVIRNVGSSHSVILAHENASSSASNRFSLPGATNVALAPGDAFLALYDATAARFVAAAQGESAGGGSTTLVAGQNIRIDTTNPAAPVIAMPMPAVFDPTAADYDLIVRKKITVSTLSIGAAGDSITAGTVVTNPPTVALAAALTDATLTVTVENQGVSGATSADWAQGGAYYAGALAAFQSAGARIVHLMVGTNDSKSAVATSQDDFRDNVRSFCDGMVAAGMLVVLSYPPFLNTASSPFNGASAALVESYCRAMDDVVDNRYIFQGADTYAYFRDNLSALKVDGVHPTDAGSDYMGGTLWADSMRRLVRACAYQTVLQRCVMGDGLAFSGTGAAGDPFTLTATAGIPEKRTDLVAAGGETQITRDATAISGTVKYWVNGLLAPMSTYTIAGATTTFGSAFSASDEVTEIYNPTTASPADSAFGSGGATGHLAWRIYITACGTGNDGYASIQEIEFRHTVGGANAIPASPTYFASTDYNGANGARAFDGFITDGANHAWATTSGNQTPSFVGYYASTPLDVAEVAMWGLDAGGSYPTARGPKDFKIQYSDDTTNGTDGTWTDAATITGLAGWVAATEQDFAI